MLLAALLLPMLAEATVLNYKEIDGIYYNLDTDTKTAEVTLNPNKYWQDVIDIPEKVKYDETVYNVTSIGKNAFNGSHIHSITIPVGVTSIGNGAFQNSNSLSSITIPEGLKSIDDFAFVACTSLTTIILPNSVTSIGVGVFQDCFGLTSITIPTGLTSIKDLTFSNCNALASIKFPDGLTNIGNGAFQNCTSLSSVAIPASVTSIGMSVFFNCSNLTSITVDEANTAYKSEDGMLMSKDGTIFKACPAGNTVTAYIIPAGVTSIEVYAFYGCSALTSVVIPASVTSIGGNAFSFCKGLANVVIGNGVTTIGENAFKSTEKLADVNFYANPATLTWTGFDAATNFMADKATKIHVKKADLATWQANFGGVNATFVGDLDGGEAEDEADANGDGEIDVADIDFVIEHIGEPIDDTNKASDVNGDGEINVADVDYIIERIK